MGVRVDASAAALCVLPREPHASMHLTTGG